MSSGWLAYIFDLDGVVTRTARVHAAAWKELFDGYFKERAQRGEAALEPFDAHDEYRRYVDGKPRYEGVRSLLEARGIHLPYGSPDDPPEKETICGLGNRKNRFFHQRLQTDGVECFDDALELLRLLKEKGVKTAVVSSSKNCSAVLEAAGLEDLFEVRVDGVDREELNLEGKPSPDVFLEAARRLGVEPVRAVVLEDAVSGVQAGRRGSFGCVVGVDRTGRGDALKHNGADVVTRDLSRIAPTDN